MNVKLVSLTKSLITQQELSAEEFIVYCARVSNPSNQLNIETADRLIAYLVKNKHWSPFEMVDMTVEIITSRAIAAQILRHRSFSFQEFSQRYAEVTDMEPVQIRRQAHHNRQSSAEEFDPEIKVDHICGVDGKASNLIRDHLDYSKALYKTLLDAGVAKEVARMVLPMSTQTKIYMKGSIRSWLTYLNIRLDNHSQLEHRQVACEVGKLFSEHFPLIFRALNQFNGFDGMFI